MSDVQVYNLTLHSGANSLALQFALRETYGYICNVTEPLSKLYASHVVTLFTVNEQVPIADNMELSKFYLNMCVCGRTAPRLVSIYLFQ
jgi:hypothetical protein